MTTRAQEIVAGYKRARVKYLFRDTRNAQVADIRAGRISDVSPELFPEAGPWQEPIIANMIDVAARDISETLAPLPSFSCASPTMHSDRARKAANLRTKIALGYASHCRLAKQMYTGADQYVTFGSLPIRVEIDYDSQMPFIRVMDPQGTYPVYDHWDRVVALYQKTIISRLELENQYPEHRAHIQGMWGDGDLEVLFYHDKDADVVLINSEEPYILTSVPNPIGKCMVTIANRPGAGGVPRGQFDDVVFVQLAKARFALLSLEIATESANAPLAVPNDVDDVALGPDAVIRSNRPQDIRRVPLEVPRDVFTEGAQLGGELQQGARFPGARTGNTSASVITGKGVDALMGGYDSQIKAHQAMIAGALQEAIALAFEVDEKVFGNVRKTLRSRANGTPFAITYTPAPAINGDYSIDVTYGLMADLDPNRWLVFGLQARAEKLFSRDFLRREMPVDMDPEDEAMKVDLEDLEEAAKTAIMGYAQAIPALASQGQDPSGPLMALMEVIAARRKGESISESVSKALTPKPPPQPSPEEMAMAEAQGGGAPGGAGPDGSRAPGIAPDGRMDGVAAGQMGQAPGGRPDLKMMLAGLDNGGQPNLQATISRQRAY